MTDLHTTEPVFGVGFVSGCAALETCSAKVPAALAGLFSLDAARSAYAPVRKDYSLKYAESNSAYPSRKECGEEREMKHETTLFVYRHNLKHSPMSQRQIGEMGGGH